MTVRSRYPTAASEQACGAPLARRQQCARVDHVTRALVHALDEYLAGFEFRRQCLRGGIRLTSLDPLVRLYESFIRLDRQRAADLAPLIGQHWRAMNALHGQAVPAGRTISRKTVTPAHTAQAAHARAVVELRTALTSGDSRPGLKARMAVRVRRCWLSVAHSSRRLVDGVRRAVER